MKNSGILLLLMLLLVSSCGKNGDGSDAYGNFESVPVLVAAESPGKLLALTIEEGNELKAGEQVGAIDTMQLYLKKQQLLVSRQVLHAKYETLIAQVDAQKVQLKNLEREYNRILKLLDDGAATSRQKDDLEGNIELLKAQIKSMETQRLSISAERNSLDVQVSQMEDQLTKATIINPIDGVVLQKYKQAGEIVAPGQTIYKIADIRTLILRAYISGSQLSSIKIGQEVKVRFDGSEGIEETSGTVTWVADEAEFTPRIIQTRDERVNLVYAVKVSVQNDGRLKIGMPGEIKL